MQKLLTRQDCDPFRLANPAKTASRAAETWYNVTRQNKHGRCNMARMPRIALVMLLFNTMTAGGLRLAAVGTSEGSTQASQPTDPLPKGAIHQLAAPAFRHNDTVLSVIGIGDGKKMITCTAKGVFLWDVATGKKLKTLATGVIERIAVSPAGDFLAISERRGLLAVYDLGDGKKRFSADLDTAVIQGLSFSPNGKVLATAHGLDSSAITLWDTATGKATINWQGPQRSNDGSTASNIVRGHSLAFHPSGKSLFSFGAGQLIEWDLATRKEIRRLTEAPDWGLRH